MNMNEKNEFVSFQKNQKWDKVNQMWVLLDSQSTIDVFVNADLLKNIKRSDKSIRIHSKAGMSVVNEIGDVGPIKNVWLDRNGIANILSLRQWQTNHFDLSPEGLYYYKITEDPRYTFIETVSDNMEGFISSQVKKAK